MTSYAITTPVIEHYEDAVAQFERLLGRLTHEESQRVSHGELEAIVQEEGSELLRRLIQGHLDQRRSRSATAWWARTGSRGRIDVKAAGGTWRAASGR